MKRYIHAVVFTLLATLYAAERPNIILIMVDDMGFSDIGAYGSEIETPNIDALAHGGVRFSQFYNSGRCCPTRATLMTGLHPHQVGIGHMTQSPGSTRGGGGPPAYQGYLNRQCVTLGEVLHEAGYATLMSGKWHLGNNARDQWPLQRGFEKYFGCLPGATRFFHPEAPRGMTLGNEPVPTPESTTDEAFYTTDAFTDYGIRFLKEEQEGQKRPSFLYLAFTAPHWPLQAFEDDIAKYRGTYKMGWDRLRVQRYQRQIALGLIDPAGMLSERTDGIPAWDSLDEEKQDEMDLKMAVYAAMIDRVDQNIGKLVSFLKHEGLFDNTLIMFLSDNGACAEGGKLGRGNFYDVEKRNQESGNSYGEAWANVGCTPFRLYKHYAHEGGTSTPFFMHWPAKIAPHEDWYTVPGQLIDLMPTVLDVAGAAYPRKYHDHAIPALDGISLRPAFDGKVLARTQPIFIEHENNAFVRAGDWKLVGRGVAEKNGVNPAKWELYNVKEDRTETRNLAAAHPERRVELAGQWDVWAKRAHVYPKTLGGKASKGKADRSEIERSGVDDPPEVANAAFSMEVTVAATKPHGVVLSHGGLQYGYSLNFIRGKAVFEIRNAGVLTRLIADEVKGGAFTVGAALKEEEMTLSIDGQVVARRASPGLLKQQPAIGFFVGEDYKDPVGKYEVPNKFNGSVNRYTTTVTPVRGE
ncbi:MAG: arylsulfatase A-like enzyme [Verrucomicrobiales bacterium]|jgi:arylsulfatase A-like enzyme